MMCDNCKADNGTFDMTKLCCCARAVEKRIADICKQYSHKRADLVAAMREQAQAKRVTK